MIVLIVLIVSIVLIVFIALIILLLLITLINFNCINRINSIDSIDSIDSVPGGWPFPLDNASDSYSIIPYNTNYGAVSLSGGVVEGCSAVRYIMYAMYARELVLRCTALSCTAVLQQYTYKRFDDSTL